MLSPSKGPSPDNEAWTLLALRSAPSSPQRRQGGAGIGNVWGGGTEEGAAGEPVARFEGKDFEFMMRREQRRVTVGRSSSKGDVDINMGHSSFVSRNHMQIFSHEVGEAGAGGAEGGAAEGLRFFLTCSGKNGIFVDGVFQRKGAAPMELPSRCTLRFPSTAIKIQFQALPGASRPAPVQPAVQPVVSLPAAQPPVGFRPLLHPLHISIPHRRERQTFASPCPSPTGTISAVNSCPTSPRAGGGAVGGSRPPLDLPSAAFAAVQARRLAGEELVATEMKEPLPLLPLGGGTFDDEGACEEVEGDGGGLSPRGAAGGKAKPPYSYAQLIVQAIISTQDRQLTLSSIYAYISKHYPYYRASDKGWQNSIRHNLSLNRFFVKVARSQEEPGKGSFWRIDPGSESKLMEQAFRRRRQRVANSFRSAPVSPSSIADGGGFTPDGTQHGVMAAGSADLYAECSSESSTDPQHSRAGAGLALPASAAAQQQRIVQLANELRYIQSAPGSPQSASSQPPLLMSHVVNTSSGNLAYHTLASPLAGGRQGLYAPQQSVAGFQLSSSATGNGGPRDADKPTVVLLKPAVSGGYTTGLSTTGDQFVRTSDAASAATLYGQLSASLVQQLQQQNLAQQQQQQNLAQQQQNLAQTQSLAQSLMLQRLFQQSGLVVGRLPSLSAPARVEQPPQALYTLPGRALSGSTLQLVLGSQLKAEPGAAGSAPQFVVMTSGQSLSGGARRDEQQPMVMDSLSAAQMMMMLQPEAAAGSDHKVKAEPTFVGVQENQSLRFSTSVSQQQQADASRSLAQLFASQGNASSLGNVVQYAVASSDGGVKLESEAQEKARNGELDTIGFYNAGNGEEVQGITGDRDAYDADTAAAEEAQAENSDRPSQSSTQEQQFYSGASPTANNTSISLLGSSSLRPHPLDGGYGIGDGDDIGVDCKRSRVDDDIA